MSLSSTYDDFNDPGFQGKLKKLADILKRCGKVAIALSGGVDSVFLLVFARRTIGSKNICALTATGPHFAADETDYAARLCSALGVRHEELPMNDILDVMGHNPPDRCYLCKREIFSALMDFSEAHGYVLTDGTNADDMKDYRPGIKALTEMDILSPLKEAGLTKQEIRTALRKLGEEDPAVRRALYIGAEDSSLLPVWEKPAFACLASRIPYGEQITAEKLSAVYRAERFLRSLGFTQVRVRHHGDVARIEVPPEDRSRFFDEGFMDMVNEHIKGCGFTFAALDLSGYMMGSLNPSGIKHNGR